MFLYNKYLTYVVVFYDGEPVIKNLKSQNCASISDEREHNRHRTQYTKLQDYYLFSCVFFFRIERSRTIYISEFGVLNVILREHFLFCGNTIVTSTTSKTFILFKNVHQ